MSLPQKDHYCHHGITASYYRHHGITVIFSPSQW